MIPQRSAVVAVLLALLPGVSALGDAEFVAGQLPAFPFKDLTCAGLTFNAGCDCTTKLHTARVRIDQGLDASDVLFCGGCREYEAFLHGEYDAAKGILTLEGYEGRNTIEDMVAAIASVGFGSSETGSLADRVVEYNLGPAQYEVATGHFYKGFFYDCDADRSKCGWGWAQTLCSDPSMDIFGLVGYVMSTETQAEVDVVVAKGHVPTYVGFNDYDTEGVYRWTVGPSGCPPYDTNAVGPTRSACDIGWPLDPNVPCTAPDCGKGTLLASDANWAPGSPEATETDWDYGLIYSTGVYSDFPTPLDPTNPEITLYCEWGGVGTLCIDPGSLHAAQRLTHKSLDECTDLSPNPFTSFTPGTPLQIWVNQKPNCEGLAFTAGCSCDTGTDGLFLTIAGGYDEGADSLTCTRCGNYMVTIDTLVDGRHGYGRERGYYMMYVYPNTGLLTLREWYDILDSVRFDTTSTKKHPRELVWNVGMGAWTPTSTTRSYYLYYMTGAPVTPEEAQQACASYEWFGLVGYLATIATFDEGRAVATRYTGSFWIGGSDTGTEGTWKWFTGPEGCAPYSASPARPSEKTGCSIFPTDTVSGTCLGTNCNGGTTFGTATGVGFTPATADSYNAFTGQPAATTADTDFVYMFTTTTGQRWIAADPATGVVQGMLCEWSPDVGAMCLELAAVQGFIEIHHHEYACGACTGTPPCAGGALPKQTCVDPSADIGNWQCVCNQPYTDNATLAAATCVTYDECIPACATCVGAMGCGADQTCSDTNQNDTSLSDWTCTCNAPLMGNATGMPASCYIDECVDNAATCPTGQACEDANQDPMATGDWECVCDAPTVGRRTAAAATCVLDECIVGCATCIAASGCASGQQCNDPDTTPAATSDWECVCDPPASGVQVVANATCFLDECNTACMTCAPQPGACGMGQTCNDPVTTPDALSDWTCTCDAPSTGMATAMSATCTYDECTVPNRCPSGQTCADPDTSPAVVGDWTCTCTAPATGVQTAGAADCKLDECAVVCPTCLPVGGCAAGQTCSDPDTNANTTTDWECVCDAPATGRAPAGNATCVLDECATTCGTCAGPGGCGMGQTCTDLNTDGQSRSDWECACDFPNTGTAVAMPATCTEINLDECMEACATCIPAAGCGAFQECVDPEKRVTATSDWECRCIDPAVGKNLGAPATCALDECSATCPTCISPAGCTAPQRCEDPAPVPASTGDWECICPQPLQGRVVAANATCTINECTEGLCGTCLPVGGCGSGQVCDDPNIESTSLSDWTCTCEAPATGAATAQTADCTLNECTAVCPTCLPVGGCAAEQSCEDPLPQNPATLSNWQCICNPPFTGSHVAKNATCIIDECTEACSTCLPTVLPGGCGVGQQCTDVDITATNNWECSCDAPSSGGARTAVAVCTLDECVTACPTCAPATGCANGAQSCWDGDTSAQILSDWECRCAPPSVGVATTMDASCTLDECATVCATCVPAGGCADGQKCTDGNTDPASTSDWQCACLPPATGVMTASSALCFIDECTTTCGTCAPADGCGDGQTCTDLDKDAMSLSDWECRCEAPTNGSATAMRATCVLDECVASPLCATCISAAGCAAGQSCQDPSEEITSTGDWKCICDPPTVGSATAADATCVLDECSAVCPTCVPTSGCGANQTCTDANTAVDSTSDWECVCPPPSLGRQVAGHARCELDECVELCSTCLLPGRCAGTQTCNDPDVRADRVADWTCTCAAPSTGVGVATNATCTLNECEVTCPTCAFPAGCGAYQACVDPRATPTSLSDWECRCEEPYVGMAVGAQAACEIDECVAVCDTCLPVVQPRGCTGGQICDDPNKAASSLWDWECLCEAPAVRQAIASSGGEYECVLDECAVECPTCVPYSGCGATQTCRDPNIAFDALRNWECVCADPAIGVAVGRPAECLLDECLVYGEMCVSTDATRPQRCEDTNFKRADDWVCVCDAPYEGRSVGRAVEECAEPVVTTVTPPPSLVDKQETVEAAGTTATIIASIAGGAPGPLQLMAVLGQCNENSQTRKFPFPLHPTQLEIQDSAGLGVVVANFGICVGTLLLGFLLQFLGPLILPGFFKGHDAQGLTAFPSGPLLVFQVLYQGFTLGAMQLVLHHRNAIEALIGVTAFAFSVGIPAFVLRTVHEGVPHAGYFYYDDQARSKLMIFFIGEGEWVSRSKNHLFMQRWSSVVRQYGPVTPWFLFVDLVGAFSLSAVNSAEVDGLYGCGHVKLFSGFIFCILFVVEAAYWPHCMSRNGCLDVIALGLQAVAMFFMATGLYRENLLDSMLGVSETLLLAAAIVLVVRAIIDGGALLYVFCSKRRSRLQEAAFRSNLPDGHLMGVGRGDSDEAEMMSARCSTFERRDTALQLGKSQSMDDTLQLPAFPRQDTTATDISFDGSLSSPRARTAESDILDAYGGSSPRPVRPPRRSGTTRRQLSSSMFQFVSSPSIGAKEPPLRMPSGALEDLSVVRSPSNRGRGAGGGEALPMSPDGRMRLPQGGREPMRPAKVGRAKRDRPAGRTSSFLNGSNVGAGLGGDGFFAGNSMSLLGMSPGQASIEEGDISPMRIASPRPSKRALRVSSAARDQTHVTNLS